MPMPRKVIPSPEEYLYKPINLKNNPDKCNEYKESLRFLDEKMIGIVSYLSERKFKKIREIGMDSVFEKSLLTIKNNIIKLTSLIDDSEMEIKNDSHFSDRLGNFESSCFGMIERMILKKKEGRKIEDVLKNACNDEAERYRNYFSECVTNNEILKKELETFEGVAIH